ncbi:hypothetical protein Moror_3688 [Moniliophthora roreri MCA 2997]|uniref:Uncharacterized protein n=2 Tax=Moniliophthora roreri TaxID=221103 RepID=V2XT02_MONRO|nr:hypothetical protein Moror_3688 [Moniliophthora roreri MCA 2997]KAI3611084.1 hypothetical protein WG66_013702 [Moniliophthora roreri]
MVHSFFGFFVVIFFFALYSSAFNVTAPVVADVDAVDNIRANWTWFRGEPTKITMHLFVYKEDVCAFGRANPVQSKNIQGDIEKAQDVGGKRFGTVTYEADKIGQYILCAYEDITPPGGNLSLSSIANSSVFEVKRPALTQPTVSTLTTTPVPTSTNLLPSNPASESPQQKGSGPSGGIIAGAVIGGVLFAGLLVAAFVIFRRIRFRRRLIAFHKERMAIAPPISTFTSGDMNEKGFAAGSIGSFSDMFPRSPQSFSTQNTLQPLRRPPV